MTQSFHARASLSAFRPASVIRTRATSIVLPPATMRSPVTLASHGVHQFDHHFDREAVRQRDRVGAAVAA
jgi:hypothetical protein